MLSITTLFEVVSATVEEKMLTTPETGTFHYLVINIVDKAGNEAQIKIFAVGSDPITLETAPTP